MEREGRKVRDIKFLSEKNHGMVLVHSADARAYARYLEERQDLQSYEAGKPLDEGLLGRVPRVEIRGEYFRAKWTSDFYLCFADGTAAVREIVRPGMLEKRAEVEKLELSRRYWEAAGVSDWKVVQTG